MKRKEETEILYKHLESLFSDSLCEELKTCISEGMKEIRRENFERRNSKKVHASAKKSFENSEAIGKAVVEAVSGVQSGEIGCLKNREGDKAKMAMKESTYELLISGDNVLLLDRKSETTSLKKAVGIMAMTVYGDFIDMRKTENAEEKEKLKTEIKFMSETLNSLSNALSVVSRY